MIGSVLINLVNLGIDIVFTVDKNSIRKYRHSTRSFDLYTLDVEVGDVIDVTFFYDTNTNDIDSSFFRKDYTIISDEGNMGIVDNNISVTTLTGSTFTQYSFVVETVSDAYNFEYRITASTLGPVPTPTATAQPEPSPTPTSTPEPTPTPTPSQTPQPTPTPTPSQTPEPTPSVTPSPTPGPEPSFTIGTGFNQVVLDNQIQSNGKIILGGAFTQYKGTTTNRIVRLSNDGSRDTSFNIGTGFGGSVVIVYAVKLQSDGKILVGGQYLTYNGVTSRQLVRLNTDGTRDTSFPIGTSFDTNNAIYTIDTQSDGKIIVGGTFTTFNSISTNKIVRLNTDSTRDTSFVIGTGFNDEVNSIKVQSDNKILVGGRFTEYNGTSRNRIIRLNTNGTVDTSFVIGSGFDDEVLHIELQSDGKILVGGLFTVYNGTTIGHLIRLNTDGSIDTSFDVGTGLSGNAQDIKIQPDDKILVGGNFNDYNGEAKLMVRINPDGSRDTSFDVGTGFNNIVYTMGLQTNNKIIVGGDFTEYKGISTNRIIRLNPDGTSDNS
jgi:uncharacterized delta-60 repeat protein